MHKTSSGRASALRLLFALLLSCAGAAPAAAQEAAARVDINALTDETQKMSRTADRMALVWWIPEEFWRAVFAQDATATKAQAEQFLSALRPYTLFVVVDGQIGPIGGVTYKPEAAVRASLQLVDAQGVTHLPIAADKVNADTKNLISVMKPLLTNMLGPLGQNMHAVVFPSQNKAGQRLLDPTREGSFSVRLGGETYKWRLPLGSVLPAKVCPVDREQLNGSWKFCPWHGERLVPQGQP